MELLYLWVEDYKNIKKQGFNFSPNHWFEVEAYEGDKRNIEDKTKEKNIKEQAKLFGENISNITGIIGKNGSGKSTLLKAIIQIITDSIPLLDYSNPKFSASGIYYDRIDDEMYPIEYDSYNETNIIYYDNFNKNKMQIFQYKNMDLDEKNYDISNFYLSEKNERYYDNEEIKKQIIFLKSKEIKKIKENLNDKGWIKFPEKIKIFQKESEIFKKLKLLIVSAFMQSIDFSINRNFFKLLFLSEVLFEDGSSYIEEKEEYFNEINEFYEKWNILSTKLRNERKNNEKKTDKNTIRKLIPRKNKKVVAGENRNNQLREPMKEKLNDWIYKFERLIEEKDKEKYNQISSLIDENIVKIANGYIWLEINLSHDSPEKIKQLIERNKQNEMDLFTYSWEGLSHGEESLLSMYSRFYNIKDRINLENCLILMDEPDNYLHPEWQRNFIKTFVDFINIVFEEKKTKFQIILTSHSPFIASDLPRENVIMLDVYDENDEEVKNKSQEAGNCKVVTDRNIKTFGANIFDLYSDAFFVESSFGEFAKSKIKDVVKLLTYKEIKDKEGKIEKIYNYGNPIDEKYVEYIIDSIGEPLVKNKLQKMYDDYRNDKKNKNSVDYKKEQLKELKKNIGISKEEIKKLLENGDLDD